MTIGEILDGAFTIYRHHVVPFLVTAFIFLAPTAFVPQQPVSASLPIRMVVGALLSGALIRLTSQAVLGQPIGVADGLTITFRRALPMLVGAVVFGLAVFAGLLCLIVPGVCLLCMWFAWQPVIVIEDRWDFFGRSRSLAREQWRKILAVSFIAWIIVLLPGAALSLSTMSILNVSYTEAARSPAVTYGTVITGILVSPFSNAVITLLYYDQRIRKEGLDVELAVDAAGDDIGAAPAGPSRRLAR